MHCLHHSDRNVAQPDVFAAEVAGAGCVLANQVTAAVVVVLGVGVGIWRLFADSQAKGVNFVGDCALGGVGRLTRIPLRCIQATLANLPGTHHLTYHVG